ncbi:hypothetical protein C8R46DRAFT_1274186 [Mycena filopes]|nr:hypothetical protein C8R46DRAFT_1274186 [Mycena filopes]
MSSTPTAVLHATLDAIQRYTDAIGEKRTRTKTLVEESTALDARLLTLQGQERDYKASLATVRRKRKRETDQEENVHQLDFTSSMDSELNCLIQKSRPRARSGPPEMTRRTPSPSSMTASHEHADLLHSLAQLKEDDRRANDELREAETARDAKQEEVEDLVAKLGAEMGSGWVDSLGREKKERPVLPAEIDGVHGSTIKGYITRGTEEAGPSKRRKMRGGRGEEDVVPEACEIDGG